MKLLFTFTLLLIAGMAMGQKKAAGKRQDKQPDSVINGWPPSPFRLAMMEADTLEKSDAAKATSGRYGWDSYRASLGDTTGMGQYGMRIYDTRIARYLTVDPGYTESNPYGVTRKPEAVKKKKVVKKTSAKSCAKQ